MTDSQRWLVLICTGLVGALLYILAPVLTPFLVGALLAYLCDPLVDRLEARRVPRTVAVLLVFLVVILVLLALLLLLVPLVEGQVVVLITKLPGYIDWFQTTVVPWLAARTGISGTEFDLKTLQTMIVGHWREMGGIATGVMKSLSQSGMLIVTWVANLVLIPVVAFYLMREWDPLVARIAELVPRRALPTVTRLAAGCDEVLGAFLRGQMSVMIALGVIYSLGLWLIGLDLALLIGMIAGLLAFVPYLGFVIGLLMAGIASLAQYHDALHLVPVLLVFGVGQLLEGMVLTPYLVGDRIGLHPVAVIFAVMVGGQLFGFFGVLFALPVAAVVMVLLRHAHQRYQDSALYRDET
jgi:predicted PurR-regulated permease PerM